MKSDVDIKTLWDNQQVPPADFSLVRRKIERFRLRRIIDSAAIVILMLSVIALGLFIWIYWPPQLITTKIGLILSLSGFMLPLLSFGWLLYLYHKLKKDRPCAVYLEHFSALKKQENRQQNIILNAYFLLLSVGLTFYMYEYTFFQSWQKGAIAYAILLAWIALNWFVFRPRLIKKRKREFADLMKDIEGQKSQFK